MSNKVCRLIRDEKTYKRYYYQPMDSNHPCRTYPLRRFRNSIGRWVRAFYLPFNPKYNTQLFPGERKSKLQMLWESLVWCFKYREVCTYYFVYGLDLKGHSPNDYMAYTEFRVLRNILNIRQRENLQTKYTFNYLALVRDKFVFYQYCKSLGMPFPKTIALVSNGMISWYDGEHMIWTNLETILRKKIQAFCKETTGEGGNGAFVLEVNNGEITISGEKSSFDKLKEKFGNATYILQERIKNHHLLSKIYPNSLNTLRLHTVLNRDGSVDFFSAVQRFGANGSVVDNGCYGGMLVGVDEKGVIKKYGAHEPDHGNKIIPDRHPNTGEVFAGIQLPYWDEIIETTKNFHKFFYGIPSLGWDIAITEDGFCYTEAGEDWEMAFDQTANGGQRESFYRSHGYALDIKLRKI